jgi:hypothetical protein
MIGQALSRELVRAGDQVLPLVRRSPGAGEIQWNPAEPLDPRKLHEVDAVVHLSGKNIAGRWTEKFKEEALKSRVQSTRTMADAAAQSFRESGRPLTLLSASAIGYYGSRGDELLTEDSPPGQGFIADVGKAWEQATAPARQAGVRVVNLRIGVVLAKHGGALNLMLPAFRMGVGGRTGSGRQFMSWISLEDVVGAIKFCLQSETLSGPVNLVAPGPVRNAEFVRVLGRELHRPTLVPIPAFAVRLIFGKMGDELLLGSLRVEPAKLKSAGYRFRHPELSQALRAVLE